MSRATSGIFIFHLYPHIAALMRATCCLLECRAAALVVPRMLRSAPPLRRVALLIRGPTPCKCRDRSRLCGVARRALHRVRDTRGALADSPVICPSGGLSTGVSSPLCKNISVSTYPKSHLQLFASHPARGAYHDRHGRRGGMRWTRQRFAGDGIAGRVERLVSDQRAR